MPVFVNVTRWFGLVCMRVSRRIGRATTSRSARQLADCEAAGRAAWLGGCRALCRFGYLRLQREGGGRSIERLLEEIEAGLIEAVVVYHADRLHRHPRELEEFIASVPADGHEDRDGERRSRSVDA